MANVLNKNPIFLDTFTNDITIKDSQTRVQQVIFVGSTAEDIFALEDKEGHKILILKSNGYTQRVNFPKGGFPVSGLYFDADDINSGLGAGDYVLIYLE